MKVSQLAFFLDNIVEGLNGMVGGPVLKDLQSFREAMNFFADRNVCDFVAFLAKCEEYLRTGKVPEKKAPSRVAKGADSQQVAEAVSAIRALQEEIHRGEGSIQKIEGVLEPLKKKTFPKAQVDHILVELKIAGKAKSKEAAIDRIRQILKTGAEIYTKTHWE